MEPARSMAARRAQLLVRVYLWAAAALMLAMVPLSALSRELGAFRSWHIGLTALLALGLAWARPDVQALRGMVIRRRDFWPLVAAAGVWLCAQQASQFLAFYTNGADFSIFDRMLYNANHRGVAFSPIYAVNHLGVHQTWVLMALAPLHRLFESPWFLLLTGPWVAVAACLPLRALARRLGAGEGLGAVAAVSYLASPQLADLVEGGFRPEVFYPLFGFALVWGWEARRPWVWGLCLAAFLAVREDAALYCGGFALANLLLERGRRRAAALMLLASVGAMAFDLFVARPAFLGGAEPPYVHFWAAYGHTTSEVVRTVLTSPLRVARDVLGSGWYRLMLPLLLLPLLSRRAVLALAPALVLFGTSSQLHDWRGYTVAVLVPFVLFGAFDGGRLLLARLPWPRAAVAAVWVAVLLWPLIGRPYVRLEPVPRDALAAWPKVEARLAQARGPICAQLSLYPHVPYALDARPLDEGCAAHAEGVQVLNLRFDPWPDDTAALARRIDEAAAAGRAERLEAGFVVLRAREQQVTAP